MKVTSVLCGTNKYSQYAVPFPHATSLILTWLASSLRSAITVLRIKYAHGSPRGLMPTHSTKVPSISPMSCRRLRISVFMQMSITIALSPGLKSAICLQCFMPSLPISVKDSAIMRAFSLILLYAKKRIGVRIYSYIFAITFIRLSESTFRENCHAHLYR